MLNDIYGTNSQWLKAADLGDSKPVVTIESAEVRENEYDGQVKKQIVLKFVGKEKQLGLNFTNASHLAELTGTQDHNEWVGVAIKLYKTSTKLANGSTAPCIRIFPELPETGKAKAATAKPTASDDDGELDSIPF